MSERLSETADESIRAPGPVAVTSPDGLSAEINVVKTGPVGVIIDRLRVTGPAGDIAERTNTLADTLRPNGTALSPIEIDPRLGGATLRSPLDRQRRFFEAEVTEDAIQLTRNRVSDDGVREPTDFSLTREALREILDGIEDMMLPEDED